MRYINTRDVVWLVFMWSEIAASTSSPRNDGGDGNELLLFMHNYSYFRDVPGGWSFIGLLATIDIVLRGFALWKSGQKSQKWWFVALLLVNSLGILPLVYLILDKNGQTEMVGMKKTVKAKSKK